MWPWPPSPLSIRCARCPTVMVFGWGPRWRPLESIATRRETAWASSMPSNPFWATQNRRFSRRRLSVPIYSHHLRLLPSLRRLPRPPLRRHPSRARSTSFRTNTPTRNLNCPPTDSLLWNSARWSALRKRRRGMISTMNSGVPSRRSLASTASTLLRQVP